MTEEELEAAIEKGKGLSHEPVRIMRNLDPATVIALRRTATGSQECLLKRRLCGNTSMEIWPAT